MKEGFQFVKVEPCTDELEFIGQIKKSTTTKGEHLNGNILLALNKAVKIKSITLKFKGKSQAAYTRSSDLQTFTITASVLPKLKTKIVEKAITLNAGQHTFPWELDIPNLYPRTLKTERCRIQYYLELKISLGVGRSFTVEHPITIHRHLVASPQSAVLINTKVYKHTSPDKFYCEIEIPRVVCAGQEYFPLSIKYSCFKGVLINHICTHLVQNEVYRVRNLSKIETEKKGEKPQPLSKAMNYLGPYVYSYVDNQSDNALPLLLMQNLPQDGVIYGIESPLIAVYHQLDVTFDLGDNKVQIRIPIHLSSTSKESPISPAKYTVESQPHQKPTSTKLFNSPVPKDIIKTQCFVGKSSPLRKCVSDQNLNNHKLEERSPSTKTAGSNKSLKPIDTYLANKLERMKLEGSNEVSSTAQLYYLGSPSLGPASPEPSLSLSPPPRRPRKKTLTSDEPGHPLSPTVMMTRIPEIDDLLPTPPTSGRLPILTTPSSPRNVYPKLHPTDPYTERAIRSISMSRSSSDNSALSRRSSSSSCSSTCSTIHPARHYPKNLLNGRNYPEAITSHYFTAELPPVPMQCQSDEDEEDFDLLIYRDVIDDDNLSINL
ncbi:hypothetical protein G6F62_003090 [Rhizopus arrhizus]|nr:hypothetical protein G6F23_004061 [Rhizopus arrhizus]KAG0759473.1 hypothetical protein G6F24_009039 [Rhizopus arrhizus]KAG0785579.1 hypothetical protein G6F21_009161 [Rhizopus arrhizus]KAG0787421.1 hypothetical protein G6F22_007325 [Rhizopus arrhizus]KAG0808390.1 hypothetical protein G6F20_009619 [Rhizopus arrhizus]